MKVVIDTNVLLMSIPKRSKHRRIFDALILGEFVLVITNEILTEYMEIIGVKTNELIANNIGEFLTNSKFVEKFEVYYKWGLITIDPDDNKFVDCAIAGNVDYIVSNDKHFNELDEIDFPEVGMKTADEFLMDLQRR